MASEPQTHELQLVASILDQLPDASVLVFDRDYRYTLARGSALGPSSFSPADLEGRRAPDVLPPQRWKIYEPLYVAALGGDSVSMSVRSPDGARSYRVSVNPLYDVDGSVRGGIALATDTTEMTRLTEALEEAERRYRLAMFSSAVGIALLDPQGRFTEVNDALCSSLGCPPADLIGREFIAISHPDDKHKAEEAFWDLLGGKVDVLRSRQRHLGSDGSVIWSDVTASALRTDDGGFLGAVMQIVDRTTEVEQLERLAQSEQRFRMLAENSGEVVFHQSAGVIRWISPAVTQLLGWTAEELTGSSTLDLWHPDDLSSALALRSSAYAGSSATGVLRCRRKDGSYVHLECVLRHAEIGAELGMIGDLRDVSARVAAEKALHAAEEQYRLIAENVSDVVLLVGTDDRITWVSPSGEALFGWRPSDVIGHRGVEFIHPDDLAVAFAAMSQTRGGTARDDEYRIRQGDGSYRWVAVRSTPILSATGNVGARVAALRDVHEAVAARQRLAASEERFKLVMANGSAGMCLASVTGRFMLVNPALCAFLGRSEDELLELAWPDVTHPEELALDRAGLERLLTSRSDGYRREKRYVRPDGSTIWGDLSVSAVRAADGTVNYLVGQIIDISDKVAAETTSAANARLLHVVLDKSPDATVRFDPDFRIEYANTRFASLCARPIDALLGRALTDVAFPTEQIKQWEAALAEASRSRAPQGFEFSLPSGDAGSYFEARVAAEVDEAGTITHLIATVRDVSRRHEAESELERLATHDPLTGLANRVMITDEITRALSSSHRTGRLTAVMMLDLDRFKTINDSLGHTVGDAILGEAAIRLSHAIRGGDLVGRQGGDEFVVVMRDVDTADEALAAATRIIEDFRVPFVIDGKELFTTMSVGVVTSAVCASANDALRDADTAMFASKSSGRDRVTLYTDALRTAASERLAMETELRRALEQRRFEVWYQPEVDLRTGEVLSLEALLRWRSGAGDVTTAQSFIQVAEDTGMIIQIGRWVMEEACARAAKWPDNAFGRPVDLRLNVSAVQLLDGCLIDDLDRALSVSGLDPRRLCMEITETALLRESEGVRRTIELVKTRGVSIALDDFGTGYGSLSYLRAYPIDVVKIDKSFVECIDTDAQDRHLVQGITALGHALGISVTGEGVETPEQARALRDLGCPAAQGYLFAQARESHLIPDTIATRYPTH